MVSVHSDVNGGGRLIAIRTETRSVYILHMEPTCHNSGTSSSDTGSNVSPIWRQDTYLVGNPLTQSELEWLRQQSLHAAEGFRQSMLERDTQSRGGADGPAHTG